MPKKHVQITDEDVEMVLKVKSEHPELNNFSAAVRWILLDYRTKIANTERQNDILDLQKKLGELSKEQSLATQLLVNMGDALGIKAEAPGLTIKRSFWMPKQPSISASIAQ
ncbi:hypothetical protein [Schleiferilactobacillus harbinensis]|uniref:hypothetical protein n=1 Tax=Schleiferilactobacillus harbinensis TaxID=304207 RepID=UPI0007BABF54|nr:hypothetical protein [Schleiferilactobacillus harbinensis]